MLWWGHGVYGWIPMVLFWGLVIWVVYLIARPATRDRDRESDAKDVLAERFARGEISEEEYRERKRVLDEAR